MDQLEIQKQQTTSQLHRSSKISSRWQQGRGLEAEDEMGLLDKPSLLGDNPYQDDHHASALQLPVRSSLDAASAAHSNSNTTHPKPFPMKIKTLNSVGVAGLTTLSQNL